MYADESSSRLILITHHIHHANNVHVLQEVLTLVKYDITNRIQVQYYGKSYSNWY